MCINLSRYRFLLYGVCYIITKVVMMFCKHFNWGYAHTHVQPSRLTFPSLARRGWAHTHVQAVPEPLPLILTATVLSKTGTAGTRFN